jgi:valyl-tRNA synthetase
LSETIENTDRLLDSYQFGEAGRQVYEFLWSEFADWYLELAKVQLNQGGSHAWTTLKVLRQVLDECLRLLHPYIPFVTEETWQQLKHAYEEADLAIEPDGGWGAALIVADWPQPGPRYPQAAANFGELKEMVRRIRAARADHNVEPGRRILATIVAGGAAAFYEAQRPVLASLARLDEERLIIRAAAAAPENVVTLALGSITCYLPLAGLVDLEQERKRLGQELAGMDQEIVRVSKLLSGPFAAKAPAPVVQKERDKLARLQSSRTEIQERLDTL